MAESKRQGVLFPIDEPSAGKPKRSASPQQSAPQPRERLTIEPGETPQSLAGKSVYVVDAHALIYQVFHAMPDMTGPQGQPVGAVHGFVRDLAEIIERRDPDLLFCAFDHSDQTFRHEIFDDYKGTRDGMPDDLRPQLGSIHRMLAAMQIADISCPNYEADDILATIARQTEELGGECFLVTPDKDCRQLISERTQIFNLRKNSLFTATQLKEEWGIRPDQVVDFQALVGDSVDNIPGVPQIGPKTARELLELYDNLEGVLNNAHEVKAKKRRENLQNGRETAELSRRLVELDRHAPVEVDWSAGCVGAMDLASVETLCREFGFRRLAERLRGLDLADASVEWETDYQVIQSDGELQEFAEQLNQQPKAAIFIEQTHPTPSWANIVGLGFCWQAGEAYYLPILNSPLDATSVMESVRSWLTDPATMKIGQNLKSMRVVLRCQGIELSGPMFDTMVADYLLDPGERNHALADLAHRYLSYHTVGRSAVTGTGRTAVPIEDIDYDSLRDYVGQQTDVPWRVHTILQERLTEDGVAALFNELEMPLTDVLAEMEFNGISIDVPRLAELRDRFAERIECVQSEVFALAGHEFNIESPKQLAEVLFVEQGLPVIKKTRTGPSTAADVLNQLAESHANPLLERILDFRHHAKLQGTYIEALPRLVNPRTGRVHTAFKQDVAATGRLSSTEPNLQNIPVRTDDGREIRSAFIPQSGWRLVKADYSQIELRVLAHFCDDEALRKAFENNEDIHRRVAAEVFGVPDEEVSDEQRHRAKAINFGVIYGQTAFGLAKSLHITKEEAGNFIDAYFDRYSGVEAFMDEVLSGCRANGYVSTILGRRRLVHGVRSEARRETSRHRNLPERIAVNTVIQGSAADLIKQAMLRVFSRLQASSLEGRMLLQIHDELLFETPAEQAKELVSLVQDEMLGAGQLSTPLSVDIGVGPTWADCKPLAVAD